MIEKLTEAKNLIDIIRQDSVTDEMILEAADAVKYQTKKMDGRTFVPEIGLKLARCLAIRYGNIEIHTRGINTKTTQSVIVVY